MHQVGARYIDITEGQERVLITIIFTTRYSLVIKQVEKGKI